MKDLGFLAFCGVFLLGTISASAVEYTGGVYRDPFALVERSAQALTDAQNGLGALKLQGIVWHTDKPRAIINNKMVKVGSKIGEAEVVGIDKEGVRIQQEGQEFVLHLGGKGHK